MSVQIFYEYRNCDSNYQKKPNVLEHIAYRDTSGLGHDSFLSMIYED